MPDPAPAGGVLIAARDGGVAAGHIGSYVDRRRMSRYANPTPLVSGPAVVAGVVAGALSYALVPGSSALVWAVVVGLVVGVLAWVGLSVRHATARHRTDRARVLESLAAPAEPTPQEQAARREAARADPLGVLLAPQRALLGLQARRDPLRQLQGWCTDLGAAPVGILAGPSGVGKTRLAVELARCLPTGWISGRSRSGRAGEVWAAVAACPDPTLIVVDDADTEPGIPELIRAATTQPVGRRRVKVLLLVRDHPTYLRWLRHQPDAPDADIPATTLTPVGGDGDRRRWFAHTVQAAAAALGTTPPAVSATDTRPVGADGDPMILTLARAVLAAHSGDPAQAVALRRAGVDELAHAVLEVEQGRWIRTATTQQGQGLLPAGLRAEAFVEAMLALVLTGPTTTAAATTTLRRLPALRGEPEKLLGNLVAWAHDLYPGGAGSLVAPVPDFLQAALVAELARSDRSELLAHLDLDLAPDLAQDPRGERAGAVLARLVRAVALFPTVNPLIGRLLAAGHPHGFVHLLEVLIMAGPAARAVQQVLVAEVHRHDLSTAEVTRLLGLIGDQDWPRLHVALQEITVSHARRRAEKEPTDEARSALAAALLVLGAWLTAVGEHRRALAASEEAVALYRDLARAEPARYTPNLANSLQNLGIDLRDVGEGRRALAVTEEAVALRRDLARAEPARYTPDLANSLQSLGVDLRDVGEGRRALAVTEEAVTLYRDLARAEPARYSPDLASSLQSLGVQLGELGERRRALALAEEAVTLRRDLARAEPARYTPNLASSLQSLGVWLSAVGEHRRALAVTEEAVTLYRDLARAEPARYTPDLAMSLQSLGVDLGELGEHRRALAVTEEAVTLRRDLARAEPARYTPDLAMSLHNLGVDLRDMGEHRRALAVTEEAVTLRRDLARAEPARYTPNLANSLQSLGVQLGELGEHRRALAVTEEAVTLYRDLARAEPARHTPNLANSLHNLGRQFRRVDQADEELRVRAEAVAWWARLARLRPDEHQDTYQRERANLGKLFTERGLDLHAATAAENTALLHLPPPPADHVPKDAAPRDVPTAEENDIR